MCESPRPADKNIPARLAEAVLILVIAAGVILADWSGLDW